MPPFARRTLLAAVALVGMLLLAAAAFALVMPRLAEPVGHDRYPAPRLIPPSGCDAFVALSRTPHPASMREIGAALLEARKPWTEVDASKLAGVTKRLGVEPAAAAFATVRSCPAFSDAERNSVTVHQVLRGALLALVAREFAAPGSARAELLDYVRLTVLRAHSARSTLGLRSALVESTEALDLLVRAGIARPPGTSVPRSDAGRIVRLQLALCREVATTTPASFGFDPGRTYDSCAQALGPWVEHFERGAPMPPERDVTLGSLRNREGDRLCDAFAASALIYPSLTTAFEELERAEQRTPDSRATPP